MKKLQLILIIFITTVTNLHAQAPGTPYNWASQIGGTGETTGVFPGENIVIALETDAADNTFALMTYRGTIVLGGTTYTAAGTSSSALPYGVILIKYSSTGSFLWAAPLSDTNKKLIKPNALTVDAAGNAIVGGEYLPYYASNGIPELDFGGGKTLTKSYQVIVAKYAAADGSCVFVKPFDITPQARPTRLISLLGCDANNNIYFASNQQGGLIDEGSKLRKLDSDGEVLWTVDNEKSVQCQGGSVDPNGNIMAGFGLGSSSAQPAAYHIGTVTFPISLQNSGVTACFDNTGAVKWTKIFKDNVAPSPIMDNSGNGYFIHPYNSAESESPYNLLSSPTGGDYPIVKIDPDGNLLKMKYRSFKNFNEYNNKLTINKATGEVYLIGRYAPYAANAITHGDLVFTGINNKNYMAILKYDTDLEEKGAHFGIVNSFLSTFLTSTVSSANNIIVASSLSLSQTATMGAATFTGTKTKDAYLVSLQGASITLPLFTKWKGITNNWNDAQNWDNGIPTAQIKAKIPAGLSKYPTIYPANPTVGIFEVSPGVTLTSLPEDLKITGLFKNNGAISLTLSTAFNGFGIDVEGTGTLTIIGTTYGNFIWNSGIYKILQKLTLNTLAGVTLNSNIEANEIQLAGSAKISTGSYQVKVLSSSPTALTGFDNTRYIFGAGGLYRATGKTGTYDFPLGDLSYYQPTKITFIDNATVSYINAKYGNTAPTPATPPATCKIAGVVVNGYVYGLGTWTFTPNVAMSAGSYNIEITASATSGVAADKIAIIKRANAFSAWEGLGTWVLTTKNTATFPNTITATLIGLTSFSDFAFGTTGTTIPNLLPVKLINFTAKADGKAVLLNWTTASELNNDKFVVEKSNDGITYSQVAELKGKGTTNTLSAYNYRDVAPNNGYNYYRLKQIDLDGRVEYSESKLVNFLITTAAVKIYPNPVSAKFMISGNQSEVAQLTLVDFLGRKAMNLTNPKHEIDVPQTLVDGVYVLVLKFKNGETSSHKLVINRNSSK